MSQENAWISVVREWQLSQNKRLEDMPLVCPSCSGQLTGAELERCPDCSNRPGGNLRLLFLSIRISVAAGLLGLGVWGIIRYF